MIGHMTDWDTAAWPAAAAAVTAMVARAPLEVYPDPAAAMTAAGGWCGQALAVQAARLGVAAWAMAAGGDDSLLLRVCDAQQAGFLLHPYGRDWVIAPGPVVTRIRIWRLDIPGAPSPGTPAPGTVRLGVSWDFTGAQRYGSAVSGRPLVRSGSYVLHASFAEHDHKFGGWATAAVDSDSPLTRAEAQHLAEEAIEAEALRQMAKMYPRWDDLKEGDARPSLNRLEVVRLLDVAP